MPENNDDRYLRLLRPVQDQLLKNWEYSISLHLDDYVEHVNMEGVRPNFPEAALILQNSVSFYSRRVDVVHKMIQELVDEVCGNNNGEGAGGVQNSKDAAKSKKRKNLKTVESDNLEVIDFVFSDKQVNGNVDKLTFVGVQPTIDIGLVSTLKKKGTSVNAYEFDGKYLGFKEEFRLFGICYFDGTVNDEFKNLNVQHEIDPLRDVPNTLDDLNDSMDRDDYDPIEPLEPSEFPSLEPSSLQMPQIMANPLSPPTLSATHSMVKESQKKARKVEWETIPSDCQIRCYRLGVENKYDFPVELQDSVELKSFKKKKRKMINEEKIEVEDHIRVMWLDRAIRVGSLDALEVRLIAENSLRNTLITSVKAFCVVEEEVHDHIDSDNDDNDFENFEYDDHDQPAPFTRIDEIVDNDAGSNYAEEAFNAIERLKAKRREDICRGTEVARRVAEWHESIAPVLEASEAQSQFNVHEYGTRILVKFPDDDHQSWRPFSTIVGGMNKNEICRHFLSTLMLANTYNVEIRKSDNRPLVKDCVELRLISKVRHHEEMDEAMRAN